MATAPTRHPSGSDVRAAAWAFVIPSLTVMPEAAPPRRHRLRELVNGLRAIARGGRHWRLLPHARPPWPAVYQPTRRWLAAGGVAAHVHDLR